MSKTLQVGICGCGDFLRWMAPAIKASTRMSVKSLFDPDQARAAKYASELGGSPVATEDAIYDDSEIDVVCLFTPPWIRKAQVLRVAEAGKHILTTKPLAPSIAEATEMVNAVEGKVHCGVIYRRTGYAAAETCKRIFDSGEIGRLALYKQDWLHHYPQWNTWALDPAKNGGPFMDAMIHNMNVARYLMGRPAIGATFFSDRHAHADLPCADTEMLKLDFDGAGAAHLFITWAADLEVRSIEGNDREHIDLFYMVTDQGWRVTEGHEGGRSVIIASRMGETRQWPIEGPKETTFDRFAASIEADGPLPSDLPGIREAAEDIKIVRDAEGAVGRRIELDLAL
jgi:predicted dehydrogenase